jgi:hypothetical protein
MWALENEMSFAMFFTSAEDGVCSFLSLVTQWSHHLYLFVLYLEPLTAIVHSTALGFPARSIGVVE